MSESPQGSLPRDIRRESVGWTVLEAGEHTEWWAHCQLRRGQAAGGRPDCVGTAIGLKNLGRTRDDSISMYNFAEGIPLTNSTEIWEGRCIIGTLAVR